MPASSWKLVLTQVDKKRIADVRDSLQRALQVGQGQANDIVNSIPIILLGELLSRDHGEEIVDRLADVAATGAKFDITDEPLQHTPKLTWPELPAIARSSSQRIKKVSGDDEEHKQITMTKFNFVVSTEHIFLCPDCGAAWRLTPLTPEEKDEAFSQREIARILEQRRPASRAASGKVSEKAAEEVDKDFEFVAESSSAVEFTPASSPEPIEAGEGAMDMNEFEERLDEYKGSHSIESDEVEYVPEPEPAPAGGEEKAGEQLFVELEALPEATPHAEEPMGALVEDVDVVTIEPADAEAFEVGEPIMLEPMDDNPSDMLNIVATAKSAEVEAEDIVELEAVGEKNAEGESVLDPNDALNLLVKTKKKHETKRIEERKESKAGKLDSDRLPVLDGDEEMMPLKLEAPVPDDEPMVEGDVPVLPPVADQVPVEEPPVLAPVEEEPPVLVPVDYEAPVLAPVQETGASAKKAAKKAAARGPKSRKATGATKKKGAAKGGSYSCILSKISGSKKRNKAAGLISKLKGISKDDAMDMLDGSFIKVLKGVSEDEADAALGKFKKAGISGRVTRQRK